jgi:hypothetical protein
VCSFSKEGEQEDGSLCGFAFANGEVCKEQSFASSMSDIAIWTKSLARRTLSRARGWAFFLAAKFPI